MGCVRNCTCGVEGMSGARQGGDERDRIKRRSTSALEYGQASGGSRFGGSDGPHGVGHWRQSRTASTKLLPPRP